MKISLHPLVKQPENKCVAPGQDQTQVPNDDIDGKRKIYQRFNYVDCLIFLIFLGSITLIF